MDQSVGTILGFTIVVGVIGYVLYQKKKKKNDQIDLNPYQPVVESSKVIVVPTPVVPTPVVPTPVVPGTPTFTIGPN